MSKDAKKNYVEEMKRNFTDNESVMIAQYQGLNVNELDSLRKELREKGILFKITKNRITKIALKETPKKISKNILLDLQQQQFRLIQFNSKNFNKILEIE